MNRASILAFGITAAVLAAATWDESSLTADDEAATPLNALVAGGMTITAEKRVVEIDGCRQEHIILTTSGSGKGAVSLRLEGMDGNPMSRVVTMSTVLWEKTIAFDQTGGTTETDLGALPGSQTKGEVGARPSTGSMQLMATTDGSFTVMIWNQQPDLAALLGGLDRESPDEVVKSDE